MFHREKPVGSVAAQLRIQLPLATIIANLFIISYLKQRLFKLYFAQSSVSLIEQRGQAREEGFSTLLCSLCRKLGVVGLLAREVLLIQDLQFAAGKLHV